MALRIAANSTTKKAVSQRLFSAAVSGNLDRMHSVENYEAVLDKFAQIRACAVLRTATSEACPKAMQGELYVRLAGWMTD